MSSYKLESANKLESNNLVNILIKKIVSGGQTGVDRAALDLALKYNIDHGGWCPKGRLAEDGTISIKYSLQETDSSDYSQRTKQNIIDSDATLILVPKLPLPENITDGTILTINFCKEVNKLHLIVALSSNKFEDIRFWIKKNNINILNVAGPRSSQSEDIYELAYNYLKKLIIC